VEDIIEVADSGESCIANPGSFHEYVSKRAFSVSGLAKQQLPIVDLLSVFFISGMVVMQKGRAYDVESVRAGSLKRLRKFGSTVLDKIKDWQDDE
jgi:hypothetical protein